MHFVKDSEHIRAGPFLSVNTAKPLHLIIVILHTGFNCSQPYNRQWEQMHCTENFSRSKRSQNNVLGGQKRGCNCNFGQYQHLSNNGTVADLGLRPIHALCKKQLWAVQQLPEEHTEKEVNSYSILLRFLVEQSSTQFLKKLVTTRAA